VTSGIRIDGARVVITGAGSGIGLVTARTFLEAGARVHVCDRDADVLAAATASTPGLTGTVADVASESDVDRLFADAAAALGGLDVLINNAGNAGPTANVEDIDLPDWNRTLDVCITGMFLATRRAVPMLKASGRGSIVNLSSAAGRFGFAMRSPYAAAKWAVVGFTKSISMELGPFDINVNAIQPGLVEGDRQTSVIAAKAAARGITPEQQRADLMRHVSMQRMVTQQEIADMALYLCSPAGHGVSGQAISVCADQTALI
jgi:NAD(P)-dependent dehydrogenase (short-subunit alcohol dehydrogenase family)